MTIAFVILSGWEAFSQKRPNIDELKAQYPEAHAIFNKYWEDVTVDLVEDSLIISAVHQEEILHLTESSDFQAKDRVYTSSFTQVDSIRAFTMVPHKKKYQTLEVTDFKESYDSDSYVFYDDSKFINFTFPGVQTEAITSLYYRERIMQPQFLGTFFLTSNLPTKHFRYTVTVDPGVELDFKFFNGVEKHLLHEKILSNGKKKYTLELFNQPKTKYEGGGPAYRYYAPHVTCLITRYTASGKVVEVLSSPRSLFNWYSRFIEGLQEEQDSTITALVNEIVDEDDSDIEKAKKIFYWVEDNIKYIAFEDGMRGFVPNKAGTICRNRYGDCKDMSSITIDMLRLAGLEAHFTWIGTRDLPYTYQDMPSPQTDNHMIATLFLDGQHHFLDATGQYYPFGLATSMIQGKEAMVALDDQNFTILKVPELPKESSVMSDSVRISLKDGHVIGRGKLHLTGYARVFNTFKLIQSNTQSIDDYLHRLLGKGNNKFFIEDYKIHHLKQWDKPIVIDYKFRIEDYYQQIGNELYINLNLDRSFDGGSLIKDDRKLPLENEYRYTNTSHIELEVPNNYELLEIPKNNKGESEVFGYGITYEPKDNMISVSKSFYLDYLLMESDQFADWNENILKLIKEYNNAIILRQKNI